MTMKKDATASFFLLSLCVIARRDDEAMTQSVSNKKSSRLLSCSFVGVARLERATACTPCKNASQLHHTPIAFAAAKIRMFFELMFTFRKKSYLCTE